MVPPWAKNHHRNSIEDVSMLRTRRPHYVMGRIGRNIPCKVNTILLGKVMKAWTPLMVNNCKAKIRVPVANVGVQAFNEQNYGLPSQVIMQLTSALLVMRGTKTVAIVPTRPNR
eukprot:8978021-Karenia_brevis.AAC.1